MNIICILKCTVSSTWNIFVTHKSPRPLRFTDFETHLPKMGLPISLTVLPGLLECLCVCSNIPEVKGPRVQVWRGRKCIYFCIIIFLFVCLSYFVRLTWGLSPSLLFSEASAASLCALKPLGLWQRTITSEQFYMLRESLIGVLFPGQHSSHS